MTMRVFLNVTILLIALPVYAQAPDSVRQVPITYAELTPESRISVVGGIQAVQEGVRYPETAMRLKIQGKVVARVFVDSMGRVFKISLIGRAHELLETEAVRVLTEDIRFTPAVQEGVPVPGAIVIPVVFKLAKEVW